MYASEAELQELLAEYPELLAGDQINPDNPCRWLFIDREFGIPDDEGSANRWSVDHLFIDQNAIPTLVEVKRQQDTRLRREIVGQLLDYAANAMKYWPGDRLRVVFHEVCAHKGIDSEQVIQEFLGDADPDEFWNLVTTNLKQGKVRLLFVADKIPRELQRIIEFLNQQMSPAEVLGVEVVRYQGEDLSTHIPRVIGQTVNAQDNKANRTRSGLRKQWNFELFIEDLDQRLDQQNAKVVRSLLSELEQTCDIRWGTGNSRGSANLLFPPFLRVAPITMYSDGNLFIKLTWLKKPEEHPFRDYLRNQLAQINLISSDGSDDEKTLSINEWAQSCSSLCETLSSAQKWLSDQKI